jgi:hypothetical protein
MALCASADGDYSCLRPNVATEDEEELETIGGTYI